MLFRQLFDKKSSTYTYLIACEESKEAVIIDPVQDNISHYINLLNQLGLTLVYALDTHVHADHITALGELRDQTACVTMMGQEADTECVSASFKDGDKVKFGELELKVLFTPGHTSDSYSFVLPDRVFTGDALLIRGTGRTDFQNGDAKTSWNSIVGKLFSLPDETLVYPAHDYKGWTVSSIGEEKLHNPRLANISESQYIEIMNNLNLPDPAMMDVAVSANKACGFEN